MWGLTAAELWLRSEGKALVEDLLPERRSVQDTDHSSDEDTPWRAKAQWLQAETASSGTARTRTLSRRLSLFGWPVWDRPCPGPSRWSTVDTSWCHRPTATRRSAGEEAEARWGMTLTRWTGRGARRTATARSAPGAWASTPLWPACLSACPWPTGGWALSAQLRTLMIYLPCSRDKRCSCWLCVDVLVFALSCATV